MTITKDQWLQVQQALSRPYGYAKLTCDAPLCAAHARQVAKNRHYCPAHFQEHTASQRQGGLFTELLQSL